MKMRLRVISEAISQRTGFFSVKQISKETSIEAAEVRVVLDRLFREGTLQRFDLIPNPGEEAPLRGRPRKRVIYQVSDRKRLRKRSASRVKKYTASDAMWKAIRAMRDGFTMGELISLAEVKRENARWFVKALFREGYIAPSRSGGPGVKWSLIRFRDPGPARPYLGRKK